MALAVAASRRARAWRTSRLPPAPTTIVGSYGAGDSFAGALVYFLARGLSPLEAAGRAAAYGAAVLASLIPLDAQLPLG